MTTVAASTGRRRFGLGCLGFVLLLCPLGCIQDHSTPPLGIAERVLPPPSFPRQAETPAPAVAIQQVSYGGVPGEPQPGGPTLVQPKPPEEIGPQLPAAASPQGLESLLEPHQTLTLPQAIEMAFRYQPRLRASLESIQQARGRDDIAYSAFLPSLTSSYSVGGYNLEVGGVGVPIGGPGSPSFLGLPAGGVLPIGFNNQSSYELAELKLQWLICDFGRRMGQYDQVGLAADIAQLQTDRAYQTVANDVATAYYQVLRARSLERIAAESVHRAGDDLSVAQKLARGGVIEREKVLRAQVALAQAERLHDIAEEAGAIAVAGLNLAMGINVSAQTAIADTTDVPPFAKSLSECLQTAVATRQEFQVARKSVESAQEGSRVAHADFAPRVVAEGYVNDFEQGTPRGHADLGLGFIKLEWGLFEGGKRVAALRVENSRIREALAQADSIADTIAFEINQSYRQMIAARKGIDRSRPAVDQSLETYRLVAARNQRGDATPAELTDAEAGLTRAQQDYFNSVYDYLTALARLEYAMGVAPSPAARPSP